MKLGRRHDLVDAPSPQAQSNPPLAPDDLRVVAGATLCRLQIWTEQEWAALAEADRPENFIHAPGLGWVGALPVEFLN